MLLSLVGRSSVESQDNQGIPNEFRSFRALNYLGSKLRMLEFIKGVADKEDPSKGAIIDLFSGAGSVSHYFSNSRRVIAVDIQEYSKVICKALLTPCAGKEILKYGERMKLSSIKLKIEKAVYPLIEYEKNIITLGKKGDLEPLCNFLENCSLYGFIAGASQNSKHPLNIALNNSMELINKLDSNTLLATLYFGGIYYSFEQTAHIDIILHEINNAPLKYQNTLMAALLSTASDIVNSVGKQFAQPIRPRKKNGDPKPKLIQQLSKDRNLCVFNKFQEWLEKYTNQKQVVIGHEVHCTDYRNILGNIPDDVKIVYADPPYTRDHYSRFYHGLETLCLQDYPIISETRIGGFLRLSRGLYRLERHQSHFCIKSLAPKAFDDLFKNVAESGKILMLSYSPYDKASKAHPRVMELEQLLLLAGKYFNNIKTHSPGVFIHSKLNHSEKHLKANNNSEIILVCRN
jgi:adenine-specific DNA methylase